MTQLNRISQAKPWSLKDKVMFALIATAMGTGIAYSGAHAIDASIQQQDEMTERHKLYIHGYYTKNGCQIGCDDDYESSPQAAAARHANQFLATARTEVTHDTH